MDGWIFQPGYPLVSARLEGDELVLSQQRFTYLPEPLPGSRRRRAAHALAGARAGAGHRGGGPSTERRAAREAETRVALPAARRGARQRGRPRLLSRPLRAELLERLLGALPASAAIERFNLVNDAWALTVAGLMPLTDYLDLTARFRERARPQRVVGPHRVVRDAQPHRRRRAPAAARRARPRPRRRRPRRARLDAAAGEDELTRQLRGDLLRALGILGDDRASRRARRAVRRTAEATSIPTCCPALIAVLAHAGDERATTSS